MKKLFLFFSILILTYSNSFSQLSSEGQKIINDSRFNNFSVEKFYLDTDKHQYFSGETVWFKLYVLEESSLQLNLLTKKVHVNLYKDQKLIDNQVLYIDNGVSYGKFVTSKDLESGTYYFQINTNYNSNFNSPASFPIELISLTDNTSSIDPLNSSSTKSEVISSEEPIIEFYPESNSLIKNIHNKIIVDTNLPENSTIEIFDINGNTVNLIKTNTFHQAIAFFNYNSSFKAKVLYNNKDYIFPLPVAQASGFTIFKNRIPQNATYKSFLLKTNTLTLEKYSNKKLFVVLHKKGAIKSFAELIVKKDQLEYKLSFNNEDIFNGINTISILNEENQVLVNHYFFNESEIDLNADFKTISKDSIEVSLSSKSIKSFANLSIAVQADAYSQNETNIKSSIYSGNYLNFNSNNFDNDLQIIAHKANPFPYKNIIDSEYTFKRENGFKIKGKVNTSIDNLDGFKVMLTSNSNGLLLVEDLNPDKTFIFNDLVLKKDSNYELALLNHKGKIIDASFYVYNQFSEFSNKASLHTKINKSNRYQILNESNENIEFINFNDMEQLQEVVISIEKENEIKTKKDLSDNGVIGVGFSKVFKVEDSPYANNYIIQFLQTLPGISLRYNANRQPFLNNDRVLKTFNNIGDTPISVILDGQQLGTDLSLIDFRQADEFQYVIFNKTGGGFGSNFPNGVITLITVKGTDGKAKFKKNFDIKNFIAEFSFSENYERFESTLLNFGTETLKNKFKTLDWHPNINLFKDETTKFNINSEGLNHLKLTINGVTESGELIYTVIKT